MTVLEARHLAIRIGEKQILSELTLAVPTGKITAILGPNGSGKSTLLKALSRVLKPQAGTV